MTDERSSGQALDINRLAELLSISTATAYRLAATGEIPSFKVGNRWRFWEHEVKQALKERDPWRRSNQARARRASTKRRVEALPKADAA